MPVSHLLDEMIVKLLVLLSIWYAYESIEPYPRKLLAIAFDLFPYLLVILLREIPALLLRRCGIRLLQRFPQMGS